MVDNPDPRVDQHEHLYLHEQVKTALNQVSGSWSPVPVLASCQVCRHEVDLTRVVKVKMQEEDVPPVRGWGTWRRG